MSEHDVVLDYILALTMQRLFLQSERLTVRRDDAFGWSSHFEEWLRVQSIVFPAPPEFRPRLASRPHTET